MKKFSFLLLFAVALIIGCSVNAGRNIVFAHPGRTDSQGGHYNHKTGEYHYHGGSGSSSNYSSGSSSSSSGWKPSYSSNYSTVPSFDYSILTTPRATMRPASSPRNTPHIIITPIPTKTPGPTNTPSPTISTAAGSFPGTTSTASYSKSRKKGVGFVNFIFFVLSIIGVRSLFIDYTERKRFNDERLRIAREQAAQRALTEREESAARIKAEREYYAKKEAAEQKFLEERRKYWMMYRHVDPIDCVDVPPRTEIGGDGRPRTIGAAGWGPQHTVYISDKGDRFHRRSCKYAKHAIHAYDTRGYFPCNQCKPDVPDYSWYKEYLRIKAVKEKYEIE